MTKKELQIAINGMLDVIFSKVSRGKRVPKRLISKLALYQYAINQKTRKVRK